MEWMTERKPKLRSAANQASVLRQRGKKWRSVFRDALRNLSRCVAVAHCRKSEISNIAQINSTTTQQSPTNLP